jgi:cell division protein FtsL
MDEKEMLVDLLETIKKQTDAVDKSNKRIFIVAIVIIIAFGICNLYDTYKAYDWPEQPSIKTENINRNENINDGGID